MKYGYLLGKQIDMDLGQIEPSKLIIIGVDADKFILKHYYTGKIIDLECEEVFKQNKDLQEPCDV
jgi:hypothetical protein